MKAWKSLRYLPLAPRCGFKKWCSQLQHCRGHLRFDKDTFSWRQQINTARFDWKDFSDWNYFYFPREVLFFCVMGDTQITSQEIAQYFFGCWRWHNTMVERNHIVSLLSSTTAQIKVRNLVFINIKSIHQIGRSCLETHCWVARLPDKVINLDPISLYGATCLLCNDSKHLFFLHDVL